MKKIRVSIDESHLKRLEADAWRYRYIKHKTKEVLVDESGDEDLSVNCRYVLPEFISYREYCGQISLDDAVDNAIDRLCKGEDKAVLATNQHLSE